MLIPCSCELTPLLCASLVNLYAVYDPELFWLSPMNWGISIKGKQWNGPKKYILFLFVAFFLFTFDLCFFCRLLSHILVLSFHVFQEAHCYVCTCRRRTLLCHWKMTTRESSMNAVWMRWVLSQHFISLNVVTTRLHCLTVKHQHVGGFIISMTSDS